MSGTLEGFEMLTEELDHPEGVAWDPAGTIFAGGEIGQIYAISLSGEVGEIASTGGEILGVAVDGIGRVYACDPGNGAVMRIDPASGSVEVYSTGTSETPMRLPNALAFDGAGNLYVTDSGDYLRDNGVVFRVSRDGETSVWTRDACSYPNGCCLTSDGAALLVVESYRPGVVRVPILPDGSAGVPETVVDLPATVPDGIALDGAGRIYVACYRPDRLYVVDEGEAEVLADDPHGVYLNAPTNIVFVGERLDRMVVANVGEWHLLIGEPGPPGLALCYPVPV